MPDSAATIDPRRAWAQHLSRIGADHGFFDRLSPRHMALFVDEGDTLLLSFDRAERTWDQGEFGLPLGFECVPALEYSLLSLISVGQTWFRDDRVEGLLADLANDGFFASYSRVLILASGPDCGHAAARAAQHIPGARVLLSRPAAAVGATHAPFESRFNDAKIIDPDTPPPMGPEALQNAASTIVLFDPKNPLEAAQAALFRAPGTTRIALPYADSALDNAMSQAAILVPLMERLEEDRLGAKEVRKIVRKSLRRDAGYVARISRASEVFVFPEMPERIAL